jgi:hypothetical protein
VWFRLSESGDIRRKRFAPAQDEHSARDQPFMQAHGNFTLKLFLKVREYNIPAQY